MGQGTSTISKDINVKHLQQYADEKMEEEIALQSLQFMQKRAILLAERREHFSWELMAVGTMTAILLFAGSAYKRKDLVIPIAPLIMGIGYRYDAAFGTQESTIRESAEKLLRENPKKFDIAGGPITLAQVDAFRHQL